MLSAALLGAAALGCGQPGPAALAVAEDDGDLLLVAGTFDRDCDTATAIIFECGRWELFVHLTPDAQGLGEKPLASEGTWAQSFLSDGKYDGTECSLWGDTFSQGTVEITESDGDSVSFTIAGTATETFDADGSYEAVRCKD